MEDIAAKMRRTIASKQAGLCNCWSCSKARDELRLCMNVCPVCGSRRCAHLADHRDDCPGAVGDGSLPDQPSAT